MEQKCLLGVFAHPDDEAITVAGSFHRYRNRGVRTALICATRGEAGEIADPSMATAETLGQVREQELREAGRIIDIDDLSFLDYHDGTLTEADEDEAIGRIVRHIRRLRPQVVVTFDANGGYGHPDHMAIHRLTVTAFGRAGGANWYPEHAEEGLLPYAPQKLYAAGFSRSAMQTLRAEAASAGGSYRPGGNAATIPLEEMGTADERVTTEIILDDQEIELKQRVRAAHQTQASPSGLSRLSPETLRAWMGIERFVLLDPPGLPGNGSEHDLFAGVELRAAV